MPRKRPNIIFILADDMGYGDVGCYNPQSKIPTPNMDKLANEGIRFTDMHSPSAVCTPTRYGILTGQYCWRTALKEHVLFNYELPLIPPERTTVASMLRKHGYHTACIGKWHLGLGWGVKATPSRRPRPFPMMILPLTMNRRTTPSRRWQQRCSASPPTRRSEIGETTSPVVRSGTEPAPTWQSPSAVFSSHPLKGRGGGVF